MHAHGTYTCGCNMFSARFYVSPNLFPLVRTTAIDKLVDFYFTRARPMPLDDRLAPASLC